MFTEKETKLLKIYEKHLGLPAWKYILLYGVIIWGFSLLIMITLADLVIFKKPLSQQVKENLPIRFVLMPLAGIAFGWYMRRITARRYQQLKEKGTKS